MTILALAALGAWADGAVGAPANLSEVVGVRQVEFNADASRVVVRTEDGTISLWDAVSGAPVPGEVNGPGQSFVVSRDGRSVLVGAKDGVGARLFATDTGAARSPALEVQFRVPPYPEVTFSPDVSQVLIFEPGDASVFEVGSGKRVAKLPLPVHPDGEDLDLAPAAIFTKNGLRCFLMTATGVVTGFDATTWNPLGSPMKHPPAEMAYTFGFAASDDGRWLATFDDPGENGPKSHLQVWDAGKGKTVGKPIVAVNGLSGTFLPGAARLLVKPGRGEASVRDLPSLKKSGIIPAHDDVDAPSVAISPDGKWIVSWGADRIVRLQDAATGAVRESQAFQARISQVLMLPDSSGCLVVFDNSSFLLQDYFDHYVLKLGFPDLQTMRSLRVTESLNRAVLSPDGRRVLIQVGKTEMERVLVFEVETLKAVGR